MKNITQKLSLLGIVSLFFILPFQSEAQTSEQQLIESLQDQLKVLLISMVEQLQDQLQELLEQEEIDSMEDNQDDYDPTKSSSYPTQTSTITISEAKTQSVDGVSNDYAEFELGLSLRAFGNETFISESSDDAVEFEVIDASDGSVVFKSDGSVNNGSVVISLSSSADLDDNKYRINEDESEDFTISSSFNPYGGGTPSGAGSYRFKLTGINYTIGNSAVINNYSLGNSARFRTPSANIVN